MPQRRQLIIYKGEIMNKKVMQFRYYTDKNKNNYPLGLKKSSLNSGEIFKEFYPIAEINI
jgi:hypothetical protein